MKLKKKKGSVFTFTLGMISSVIILFLAVVIISYYILSYQSVAIQNNLAISNLSSYKAIDKLQLGDLNNSYLRISDPMLAYETVLEKLKVNLNLDDELKGKIGSPVMGKAVVDKFIIYNYNPYTKRIEKFELKGGSFVRSESNKEITPLGLEVDKTMVHITLRIDVKVAGGINNEAYPAVDTFITKI